jgi:hypothetical protein
MNFRPNLYEKVFCLIVRLFAWLLGPFDASPSFSLKSNHARTDHPIHT